MSPAEDGEGRAFARFAILPCLAAGALALLLAPDATPAIVPRTALVWTLVALGGAALFSRRRALHLAAAVLLAFAAEHLLWSPGLPRGHDLLSHSWGIWSFFKAMHDGDPTPHWLHHLSLGLPLPMFYSPATYYSLTPFYWAGFSVVNVVKSAFVLHAVVGAVGMYFLGRRWTGSSRAGVVAAAAYAFAPYRLLDAHYRIAVGESAALALFPLLFGLAFDPGTWSRRRLAACAMVAAALILTHPLSALSAGVAALVWQGVEVLAGGVRRARRAVGARVAAAVLGLVAAGIYVVPMVHRLPTVSLQRAVAERESGETRIARQGLRPTQPLRRLAWRGVFHPEPRGAPRDADGRELPPYLGWALCGCTLLAAAIGLRKAARRRTDARAALELPVAAVALASLALTFHPSAVLLAHLPLLPTLQFAWRFLGPATFAGALAAAFVARSLAAAGRGPWWALLLVLLVADGLPFTGAADWVPPYRGFVHFYVADRDCGERWGCWAAEPVDVPQPIRVYGSFLPPSDFGVDATHVKPGFGEYLNSRALELVLAAEDEGEMGKLGARWIGGLGRRGVTEVEAEPYARWRPSGTGESRALPYRRRAETIDVELPGTAGVLVLLEQYNPAWEARSTGRAGLDDTVEVGQTADGLMRLAIRQGSTRVRLRFRVTGGDVWAGRAATLLALALCAALTVTARRAER